MASTTAKPPVAQQELREVSAFPADHAGPSAAKVAEPVAAGWLVHRRPAAMHMASAAASLPAAEQQAGRVVALPAEHAERLEVIAAALADCTEPLALLLGRQQPRHWQSKHQWPVTTSMARAAAARAGAEQQPARIASLFRPAAAHAPHRLLLAAIVAGLRGPYVDPRDCELPLHGVVAGQHEVHDVADSDGVQAHELGPTAAEVLRAAGMLRARHPDDGAECGLCSRGHEDDPAA
mmetsp:Transcript_22154/g.61322  ORF Transcript_22154/g.61322 Transcript_22154/m.61322 type:complete len:236 (-) Transcript_22154:682-1389(-)